VVGTKNINIVIGCDTRISSNAMKQAVILAAGEGRRLRQFMVNKQGIKYSITAIIGLLYSQRKRLFHRLPQKCGKKRNRRIIYYGIWFYS